MTFIKDMLSMGVLVASFAIALPAHAWDVECLVPGTDEECPDPFARARTYWQPGEHSALLALSLSLSGLPSSLNEDFELETYSAAQNLTTDTATYPSVRPVPIAAERTQIRSLSVSMMASLPDFSYTLWDWASGHETCPPDPGNPSALDCHNYETHIGWLNSNHMLPQAQRWYAYLHGLAVGRASECARVANRLSGPQRARFIPWLLLCEKEALVIEGVAHHYLQDAWASGHMMERWGSTEPADFGGDRALGFAVGAFVGAIHGAKAMLDDDPTLGLVGPWDDPINAPNENVSYQDTLDPLGTTRPGVGDRFLAELLSPSDEYGAQREALLGCSVSGLREVYAATSRLHGPLGAPSTGIDGRRSIQNESCWGQRITNLGFDTGIGIHQGAYTGSQIVHVPGPLAWAVANFFGVFLLGAPELDPVVKEAFRRDMSRTVVRARVLARFDPKGTDSAGTGRRGLVALAGIGPNSEYARGGAGDPPSSYSDPLLPWTLTDPDPAIEIRKQALHLAFSDAHASDRCESFSEDQLESYVDAARAAKGGDDVEREEATCGQCVAMIAPHLRFGRDGDHDVRREAYCALAGADSPAFLYTGENPDGFSGAEPDDMASLEEAAFERCGCGDSRFTLIAESPGAVFSAVSSTLSNFPSIDQDGTVAFVADPILSPIRDDIYSASIFSEDLDGYERMTSLSGQIATGSIHQLGTFLGGVVVFQDVSFSESRRLTTDGESIRTEITSATCDLASTSQIGAQMTDDGAVICDRGGRPARYEILRANDGSTVPIFEVAPVPTPTGAVERAELGPFNGNGVIATVAEYNVTTGCQNVLSRIEAGSLVSITCVDEFEDGGNSVDEIYSINASGVIAYSRDEGSRNRVFLNEIPTNLTFPGLMNFVVDLVVNDLGSVAFMGSRLGVSGAVLGIYTGTDLSADKVIEVGDPLFGAAVRSLSFHRYGFNNAGQIAFKATLDDGRTVIVRAEP